MATIVTPLQLGYIDGKSWALLTNFVVISDTIKAVIPNHGGTVVVPAGFTTDFNSIPRGLWNIFPPDEDGEAGVVHDYLYRYGALSGHPLQRVTADKTHREFVHMRHPAAWKESAMYWGLRLGGWKPWNAYRAAEK